jgi:methylamine utilization protein MauE
LAIALRVLLAAVLLGAAVTKLAHGRAERAALGSYGLRRAETRAAVWATVIALEAALATVVVLGVPGAPEAAAGLMAVFALALAVAIFRGAGGKPCGCFGRNSQIGWPAVARASLLSLAFLSIPLLPHRGLSTRAWVEIGLVAALAAIAALTLAVVALAREVGELRLAIGPQRALSLEDEGPELGTVVALPHSDEGARLTLAVFTSANCPLCDLVRPALRLVAADPEVVVREFDEQEDATAWDALEVPGSPYGVVLEPDGRVVAKGTFNTLPQLESLLAGAREARLAAA